MAAVEDSERVSQGQQAHVTDAQLEAIERSNLRGPQGKLIARLVCNIRQAREANRLLKESEENRQETHELLDRTPPRDLFAERIVLGTLIINPDLLSQSGLGVEHFHDAVNVRVFERLLWMAQAEIPIDVEHLVAELKSHGEWFEIGAYAIAEMIQANCTPLRFNEYAARLQERLKRRRLLSVALEIVQRVYSNDLTDDVVSQSLEELGDVA